MIKKQEIFNTLLIALPFILGAALYYFSPVRNPKRDIELNPRQYAIIATHPLTVIGSSNNVNSLSSVKSNHEKELYTIDINGFTIKVEKNKLYINQNYYGTLQLDDRILLDHGTIKINGKTRNIIK